MMWGIRPGPMLFQTKPDLVWGLFASMYIGNVMLVLMNIFLIPAFVTVLRLPYTILMGLIVVFSTVGAFSANNNFFDVWMMLGLGVLGYLMKKLHYPVVPLILALVLGKLAENSLRQALTLSGGSMGIFFKPPDLGGLHFPGHSGLSLSPCPMGNKKPADQEACLGMNIIMMILSEEKAHED